MYCKGCNYSLTGLMESRCPECGRTFDPQRPSTYRKNPTSERRRQLMRFGIRAACIVIPIGVLLFGTTIGTNNYICRLCGARSHTRYLTVLSIGGNYDRSIEIGPTSKFIQHHTNGPCPHEWQFYHGNFGPIFSPTGCALGDMRRFSLVRMLDNFGTPDDLRFFEHHAREDPSFANRFIQTVRNPTEDSGWQLLNELVASLETQSGVEAP